MANVIDPRFPESLVATRSSWEAIYRTLAAAFPPDRYHRGATLTNFGNGEGGVQAHIDGHGVVEADLLVAADGAQSPTRRRFLNSTYVGYVAWRGRPTRISNCRMQASGRSVIGSLIPCQRWAAPPWWFTKARECPS
jgi:hypothetical protein